VAVDAKLKIQGKKLTFRSYRTLGKYAASTIGVRFGTWNDGLRKAGLTPSDEKNVPIEALFDNLKLVWIAKGKQPVYRDMSVAALQIHGVHLQRSLRRLEKSTRRIRSFRGSRTARTAQLRSRGQEKQRNEKNETRPFVGSEIF